MIEAPPLELFFSPDWIAGTFASRTASTSMQVVVDPQAGRLVRFGDVAAFAADLVPAALEEMWGMGQNAIQLLQSGDAANIAGWAAKLIGLVYSGIVSAAMKGAKEAKANALASQWDIASYLVVRRTALAGDLPGGGNFVMTQPGWKKDWPDAAVPAVPQAVRTYIAKTGGPDIEGKEFTAYQDVVLFKETTANGVDVPGGCFSLGGGGCDLPPNALVGLSLLTWPILVEDYGLPWGGAQLLPFVTALCSPTAVHVQVRQADVDALRTRMRAALRSMWRVRRSPVLLPDAVTVWPDGTYAEPTADQAPYAAKRDKILEAAYAKWLAAYEASGVATLKEWAAKNPWEANKGGVEPVVARTDAGPFITTTSEGWPRYGEDRRGAQLSPIWSDLESVSAAFRTLARWQQCRDAAKRNFSKLTSDVRALARKNPDFSDAEIAAAGGPNNGRPPAPKPSRGPGDFKTS